MTYPQLLRRSVSALTALALTVTLGGCKKNSGGKGDDNEKHIYQGFAMDAPLSVTQYGSDDFSAVKNKAAELDDMLSAYSENGEIAKLNTLGSAELTDTAAQLVKSSVQLYDEYGCVNPLMGNIIDLWNVMGDEPRVPDDEEIAEALHTADISNLELKGSSCTLSGGARLNFGATGKGFALDEIKKVLDDEDMDCAVVSFGSSTLLYGSKPDGKPFKVSISSPDGSGESFADFTCGEGFVSTSGGYERFFEADGEIYIHIFDEKTGRPVDTDLVSVTVVCQSGILSDFLSTRIFIGGSSDIDRWLDNKDIWVCAVREDGGIYCTDEMKDSLELYYGSSFLN